MKRSGTKTGLFLLELVIALLLFAFCAAICVQIFMGAKFRTRDSEALSKSVFLASSAAELYKAYGGDLDELRGAYGKNSASLYDGLLIVYYDENWEEMMNPMFSSQFPAPAVSYALTIADKGGAEAEIAVYNGLHASFQLLSADETPSAKEIYGITVKAVDIDG
jgi:type II secretory pathway pseudopilin PulG